MTTELAPTKREVWNVLTNKKPRKQYNYKVPFYISGIPCLLGVDGYEAVSGSYSYHAASDVDYYGYVECEYDVLDRKGYPAAWLERKMTEKDFCLAEEAIAEYLKEDEY
jgi:hypothetical protein